MEWIKRASIRALKTVAQTSASIITVATCMGEVDWKMVASSAALAGILSVLTSVAGLPELKEEDESYE